MDTHTTDQPTSENIDCTHLPRRLTLLYILALSTIAALAIMAQIIIQVLLAQQASDSHCINIAGRQRMLSQRISKAALALQSVTDPVDHNERFRELHESAALWERSHRALHYGDAEMNVAANTSATITAMFAEIEPHHRTILDAVADIEAIVASAAETGARGNLTNDDLTYAVQRILNAEGPFLVGMDAIVFQYAAEARERVAFLKRVEIGLLGATLLVLLLEGIFIFRPTVARLSQTLTSMQHEIELEHRIATRTSELHQSQTLLQGILEHMPAAIFVVDSAGRYLLANQYAARLVQKTPEEITGKTPYDLISYEIAKRWDDSTKQVYTTGLPLRLEDVVPQPDGTHTYLTVQFPLFDNQGAIYAVGGIATDISERLHAEQALRTSEARLQHLLRSSPMVLFSCMPSEPYVMTYVSENMVSMLGYTAPEAMDPSFWGQGIHPDDVPHVLTGLNRLFETGEHYYEYRFRHRDGSYRWVQNALRLVYDSTGTPLEVIGTSFDITERKNLESELREAKEAAEAANHAKSTFLATMSHELRTPLNAILGFTQIMLEDPYLPDNYRDTVHIIGRSGRHLLLLINDILDMSKIEAGHLELHETSFDLVTLLRDIHDMFSLRAHEKGISLHLHLAPDVPHIVDGDEKKLRQIVINLISNAIKFTHAGGVTVTVSVASKERLPANVQEYEAQTVVHISVQDSGIGIAPEHLENIFTPFSQIPSTNQEYEGTGLGLPISQQFVLMMGGDIIVTSTLGEGSTFDVLIPLRYATGAPYSTQHGTNGTQRTYDTYDTGSIAEPNPYSRTAHATTIPPEHGVTTPCATTLLQHMPTEWLHTLCRAARVGNIKQMETMIEELVPHHPDCSRYLLSLVDAFRFTDIEDIIEQALGTHQQEGV